MSMDTFLVRTMSDTVETDIQRVFTITNEILPRYEMPPLSLAELRKIADGPFDLFLIPLIFAKEYQKDRSLPFNEAKRVEIRTHALEIARKHGFDVNPPDFISGIEQSLKSTKEAGLRNVLMTTGGQALQASGDGKGWHRGLLRRNRRSRRNLLRQRAGTLLSLPQAQGETPHHPSLRHCHLHPGRQQRPRLQSRWHGPGDRHDRPLYGTFLQ